MTGDSQARFSVSTWARSRLNEAGVNDKEIQSILRHADVSTTRAYYILPNHERAQAGMKKLEKTLKAKYGIKG